MPERLLEKRGQSMAYRLRITEYAEELLDNLVGIFHQLENYPAKL